VYTENELQSADGCTDGAEPVPAAQVFTGNRTLRTQDISDPRHFGPKIMGPKCPDTSVPGPKCLGSEVSWV